MVRKYRKKPIVIEAFQWDPAKINFPHWCHAMFHEDGRLSVETREGIVWAEPRDWIISCVTGEVYCLKDHIFQATYEDY